VSPDLRSVQRLIDRARYRALLIASAESAAAGAIVGAWSAAAGLVVAVVVSIGRVRSVSRSGVLRTLERQSVHTPNLLTTAEEIGSGHLEVKNTIADRVGSEAAAAARSIDVAAAFPLSRLIVLATAAIAIWGITFAIGAHRAGGGTAAPAGGTSAAREEATPAAITVTVTIEPPPYTGLAPSTLSDPPQVTAVEHSLLRLSITAPGPRIVVDFNGEKHPLERQSRGRYEFQAPMMKSGYAIVEAEAGRRRLIPITVTPDVLPDVRIVSPARDLVYEGGNPRIAFSASATDDFGIDALTLRYTKVSGSGEQFEFTDGEIPFAIDKRDRRNWTGSAARTLGQLDLAEGDMLVYRAVATDVRPGGGESSSDAFFIEISRLGVAAGDAFTLPEQETRYALSQQMLIVKTDRLNQRRSSMAPAEFAEASQGLAVEQRMIRSEFVFMLGGEIEDEEVEAEQSVEVQAGRLANRGQRDIRAATIAMSQAEKLLTGGNTAEALKAERAAVEALQRAFARDRYILRALATRSQLDPARRLTGVVDRPLGWRRVLPPTAENRRAALLQSVLEGLGEADRPEALIVLAEFALKIDSQSAALRQIAADLQQLADAWPASSPADRQTAASDIAAAVAREARAALADPPATPEGAR
jgi:hypothetical protein